MDIIIIVLNVILILAVGFLLFTSKSKTPSDPQTVRKIEEEIEKLERRLKDEFKISREETRSSQKEAREELAKSVENLKVSTTTSLEKIQKGNEDKLEKMRETVDEKLKESVEKRFNESFKHISTQLEQVYKGLGEMQSLSRGVGDLKKVMEGVKTRGIFGEVQLKAIISDILVQDQYEENIATKSGSNDRVEFAIKMPGKGADSVLYLPIDSKFPIENYQRLVAASEKGEKSAILESQKALATDVKTQAKKISEKYLDPPQTTDFGILFVPTESLYAEILRIDGLFEKIRQDYKVTIVGPTTLTALLDSLLMGFRTLAIEKRSSEVWEVLGAVKAQFSKFSDLLAATHKKLTESANKIGEAEQRSRVIERNLKSVEALPVKDSIALIGDIEIVDGEEE